MPQSPPAVLKNIYIYPIKSLGGISLNDSQTLERGLPLDRRWLLVDSNNRFITQRTNSNMSLISVTVCNDGLEVQHKKGTSPVLKIPFDFQMKERLSVTIFNDQVEAPFFNDPEIESWFHRTLGIETKLVFMDELAKRPVNPEFAKAGEEVSFADGYPYHLFNQASLDDLNVRLEQPITMQRFRPNLVVEGAQPYEEDHWDLIQIGSAVFKSVKPCSRCVVTTIDPDTGEKGLEPLKTLSTYRKYNNKILMGLNLVLLKPGKIKLGDQVKIIYKQ